MELCGDLVSTKKDSVVQERSLLFLFFKKKNLTSFPPYPIATYTALGHPRDNTHIKVPTPIPTDVKFKDVACGRVHTVAVSGLYNCYFAFL